jgi:hypothetical protein
VRSASPPARARLPSDAIPTTTVTKITGPVMVWMSWMNASASHLASFAGSGATRPKTMPAAIAISTQIHRCVYQRRDVMAAGYSDPQDWTRCAASPSS